MTKVIKVRSLDELPFEDALTILDIDTESTELEYNQRVMVLLIQNTFAQLLNELMECEYRVTFRQMCFILSANTALEGKELYEYLNYIYEEDYDKQVVKEHKGLARLALLAALNAKTVNEFNEFSKRLARYRIPTSSTTSNRKASDFVEDIIYIACKGDVSKLAAVYELDALDVLMFIEQEAKKSYEIYRQQKLRTI
jgi:hypothetical protein